MASNLSPAQFATVASFTKPGPSILRAGEQNANKLQGIAKTLSPAKPKSSDQEALEALAAHNQAKRVAKGRDVLSGSKPTLDAQNVGGVYKVTTL